MNQEDKPQSSSHKEKKEEVTEGMSVREDVAVVLKRVDELLDKAKEYEDRVKIRESEIKKDEESIKEIKRRYNIT